MWYLGRDKGSVGANSHSSNITTKQNPQHNVSLGCRSVANEFVSNDKDTKGFISWSISDLNASKWLPVGLFKANSPAMGFSLKLSSHKLVPQYISYWAGCPYKPDTVIPFQFPIFQYDFFSFLVSISSATFPACNSILWSRWWWTNRPVGISCITTDFFLSILDPLSSGR